MFWIVEDSDVSQDIMFVFSPGGTDPAFQDRLILEGNLLEGKIVHLIVKCNFRATLRLKYQDIVLVLGDSLSERNQLFKNGQIVTKYKLINLQISLYITNSG